MDNDPYKELSQLRDRLAASSKEYLGELYYKDKETLLALIENRSNLIDIKIDNEVLGRLSLTPMWYLIIYALLEIKRLGRKVEESDEIWQIISSPIQFDKYSITNKSNIITSDEVCTIITAIDSLLSDTIVNNFDNFDLPIFSDDLKKLQNHLRQAL
ncbi:hypothetical protein [Parasulfitobacter algicola]|uniref:Uncharacterized protein n=1 Tax=Parasulfitobacter algicola TaxID=2614809 RepID=A0ABX2IXL6_9RHOB|nr:hypothetical protein [Sulfitobacter algicola]NSX56921.1 hypothetical protein [Sulfitobacter algicola]